MNLSQRQYDFRSISSQKGGSTRPGFKGRMRCFATMAVLLAVMFAAGVSLSQAQSDEGGVINREYAIKAAYLYQFGYYIQWPANSFADDRSPFIIGVLGAGPFGDALNDIAREKKIAGRPIEIKRFASIEDYKPCHILFVTSSAVSTDKLADIQKSQKFPVLLVGETPGFADNGGTINLFIEQNRIRFEVNMEVAKREQLKISSKLLNLAKIVGTPQQY